jgi:hypothetical protein
MAISPNGLQRASGPARGPLEPTAKKGTATRLCPAWVCCTASSLRRTGCTSTRRPTGSCLTLSACTAAGSTGAEVSGGLDGSMDPVHEATAGFRYPARDNSAKSGSENASIRKGMSSSEEPRRVVYHCGGFAPTRVSIRLIQMKHLIRAAHRGPESRWSNEVHVLLSRRNFQSTPGIVLSRQANPKIGIAILHPSYP